MRTKEGVFAFSREGGDDGGAVPPYPANRVADISIYVPVGNRNRFLPLSSAKGGPDHAFSSSATAPTATFPLFFNAGPSR